MTFTKSFMICRANKGVGDLTWGVIKSLNCIELVVDKNLGVVAG
jgi:hypothetical protein